MFSVRPCLGHGPLGWKGEGSRWVSGGAPLRALLPGGCVYSPNTVGNACLLCSLQKFHHPEPGPTLNSTVSNSTVFADTPVSFLQIRSLLFAPGIRYIP